MKMLTLLISVLMLTVSAGASSAACYADYKAKQDNPLRLHYGVMRIDMTPCTMSDSARQTVESRLKKAGWRLLQVQSVFDDSGLEKRKKDAAKYFLRF